MYFELVLHMVCRQNVIRLKNDMVGEEARASSPSQSLSDASQDQGQDSVGYLDRMVYSLTHYNVRDSHDEATEAHIGPTRAECNEVKFGYKRKVGNRT